MSFTLNKNDNELTSNRRSFSFENELTNSDCWWDETFNRNFRGKRDAACGSRTSLKIWYTNPYPYSIRVAFYLRDTNGNLNSTSPYVINVKPGKTVYHHKCYSNGRYTILAARSGSNCTFPKLN
ncbi:hypothetical protein H9W90_05355 [Polaribacter pectinis]|uniref:Uncharacterized protein n=1 Tax=Polaribacter pectinis TaxID=2738844 RepID=A0A7G9LD48_9FLAO|nr:hypothetical protein [Polaribacter pectinis]QNM86547.1 hypothetical protein H9W90_05355 [Polaribacter pectinis]